MLARWILRLGVLTYLSLLLLIPLGFVFYRAFEHGFQAAWHSLTTGDAGHALWLTVLITLIAVPANTGFGILCGLPIVRQRFPGKGLLNAVVDLPLALSPIVVGLAIVLVYGRYGWFGGWLADRGIQIVFALPGMIVATIFVSLPF